MIRRGQRDGTIASTRSPEPIWDQIYGTIFYRFQFGLRGLNKAFVKEPVETTLAS